MASRSRLQGAAGRDGRRAAHRAARSRPVLTYGPEVIDALRKVWAVLDGPTGKRLAPIMSELVASLRRHGELDIDDALAA